MLNPEQVKDDLIAACDVHGKTYTDALLNGWIKCTSSVSDRQFKDFFWGIAIDKFPKPSDLLQAIAGIVPEDDWEKIMAVATGRLEVVTISGYAAASLRQLGGVRSISNADEIATRIMHKQFLEGIQTAGSGLPAAEEQVSLVPIKQKQSVDDHFYPADSTGEIRANSLIRCLKAGTVSPRTARMHIAGSKSPLPDAVSTWLPAQRDRVLACINDLENPEPTSLGTVVAFTLSNGDNVNLAAKAL
ncbi:MAG: hypothetical protein ACRCZS_24410 [Chroococcidiopsis sp.]